MIIEPISMSAPDIGARERELVLDVLSSGTLSGGPYAERFERMIAERLGAKHAVAVSSGTAGLHTCIVAAGLGPGDQVITTPFSFVASVNCVLFEHATPVFADIDPVTLNIDPVDLEKRITDRTRAILVVHVFGQPVDMDAIRVLAKRHGLSIIEDACEAFGAEYKGRQAGTLGDAAVFAFYPNKQITTAEGGVVVTQRDDIASSVRALRNQGRDPGDLWLNHSRLGFNYRMSELHAAIGVAQLERADVLLANRVRVADLYSARLSGHDDLELPAVAPATTRMSWFVYVVRLRHGIDRDEVMRRLQNRGIPTRPYFPPIHCQQYLRGRFGYTAGMFPVAEREAARTVALPFHGSLSEAQVDYVSTQLEAVLKELVPLGR